VGLGVIAADGIGDHSHALSLASPLSFLYRISNPMALIAESGEHARFRSTFQRGRAGPLAALWRNSRAGDHPDDFGEKAVNQTLAVSIPGLALLARYMRATFVIAKPSRPPEWCS
jgi:hypothetical protein